MDSSEIKSYIFYYKSGKFEEFKHHVNDTCEDFCKFLCRQWNFPPLVHLLFGLRIHEKNLWLAGSRPLVTNQRYEFRIRIKVNLLIKIFSLKFRLTLSTFLSRFRKSLTWISLTRTRTTTFITKSDMTCYTTQYQRLNIPTTNMGYLDCV